MRWKKYLNKITHGDCLELMKELPDGIIDLVVTSPPYDELREYGGHSWSFEIFMEIADELSRVLSSGGVIVWIVGDQTINGSETGTSFKQALYFKEVGLNIHDTMIWKKKNIRYSDINRYYQIFEYMFILSKGKPKTTNLIADRKNKNANQKISHKLKKRMPDGSLIQDKNIIKYKDPRIKEVGVRLNIWEAAVSTTEGEDVFEHPATFPKRLIQDHIVSWSNPDEIVLDPFMGSGTSAIASLQTGRQFIGFEVEKKYAALANERIEHHKKAPFMKYKRKDENRKGFGFD